MTQSPDSVTAESSRNERTVLNLAESVDQAGLQTPIQNIVVLEEPVSAFTGYEKSLNWFKNLFLGVLGSIALSRAIVDFSRHVLQIETFYVARLEDIITLFGRVSILYWFILFYFIINTIRYYLASFIFDRLSHDLNTSPKGILKRLGMGFFRLPTPLQNEINNFFEQENSKWQKRTVFLVIIDLMFSCLIIFFIGIAGNTIGHFIGFATISLTVLFIDILQIVYQWSIYVPKRIKLQNLFLGKILEILNRNTSNDEDTKDSKAAIVDFINRVRADHLEKKKYTKTLRNWLLVDLGEFAVWILMIWSYGILHTSDWITTAIGGCLILTFIIDILINSKMWIEMLGLGTGKAYGE